MPRFFVAAREVEVDRATLRGSEFRHLQRVLRLREGDQVTLFDDAGKEHAGVILTLSPRVAVVRITATTVPARESPLAITLYQGVPKGRKMDLVIEKATELGVHAVVPMTSAFSVAGATAGKHERWQRIALAAAKQSGRTQVPALAPAQTFTDAVAAAAALDLKLLFFEGAGAVSVGAAPDPPAPPVTAAVIVGPEGGFSRDEVARARDAGFLVLALGPRVLRTETAALVALALVQARWGDLGGGARRLVWAGGAT